MLLGVVNIGFGILNLVGAIKTNSGSQYWISGFCFACGIMMITLSISGR